MLRNFLEIGYDAKQAEERLKATKRRKLQAIDKSNKPLINESSQESGLPDTYTFLEKLTAQIIKNVQVDSFYPINNLCFALIAYFLFHVNNSTVFVRQMNPGPSL